MLCSSASEGYLNDVLPNTRRRVKSRSIGGFGYLAAGIATERLKDATCRDRVPSAEALEGTRLLYSTFRRTIIATSLDRAVRDSSHLRCYLGIYISYRTRVGVGRLHKKKVVQALRLKIRDLRAQMPAKRFLIGDPRYNLVFSRSQKGTQNSCIGTSTSMTPLLISEAC